MKYDACEISDLQLFYCFFLFTSMIFFQNIELKVEVESLKKELEEKQELLDKAQ